MGVWQFTRNAYAGGSFKLVISTTGKYGVSRDVTYVRGAPTQIDTFSDADPFGDSTAQFTFPAITAFDDLHSPDLPWLGYYSNVDLYWVTTATADQPSTRLKLWEGFIASIDYTSDAAANLQVSCQGALFQLDRYLQKPFFPPQPWPLELLIADVFDRTERPHLRTAPLRTLYPTNWGLKIPAYNRTLGSTSYTPVGKPGSLWCGYASRQTGAWEHALTGFVQDQLSVMITDGRSRVREGNQWTIRHYRQGQALPRGLDRLGRVQASVPAATRTPVLMIRDRFRAPDFTVQLGAPGVGVQLSGDSTQSENVIYGDGTGVDGTSWHNSVVSDDGRRTDYLPLAADRAVYPVPDATTHNPSFRAAGFVSEAITHFGNGFNQDDATLVAQQQLQRDRTPGWTGTITLGVDPSPSLPRWCIHAGMTVLLKGFGGSGDRGVPFHISATAKNVTQGSVELTVDTRYRDLLTVEEAQARTRDPLTPVKMLQVNRTSVTVEDIQAPWNYRRSGMVPRNAFHFFDYIPRSELFPYTDWTKKHPPSSHPHMYVKCRANAGYNGSTYGGNGKARWAGPVAILTSERGSISRSQFAAYDFNGRVLKVPFHVSIYYSNTISAEAMPHLRGIYSPYLDNAFETTNPYTGQPANASDGNLLAIDESAGLIIGWGNKSNGVFNRAGFSPGRETEGAKPTGLLVDDFVWQYDNTHNPNYDLNLKPGKREKTSAIMLYAMFYCEHPEPVYFMGRVYRQNPGAN